MKLPKLNLTVPKFLKLKTYEIKQRSLFRIWKKFLNQIPREFRSAAKMHQHFLILGDEKSGKSDLIHNIVEQSQNIYPFEVDYTEELDMQFYLGPKQLIQEMSTNLVKDRSIRARKSIIYLWKRLYAKNTPIVILTYNCFQDVSKDSREANKSARLIAGKLSLLSEITKEPLKIRVALTHLDKIEGYIEFAHFLKQHNIAFEIPLVSNFESASLETALSSFREKYLSLILTSATAEDFLKILRFFHELPSYFPHVEEFLRSLTTGNTSNLLELEKLTFTANVEAYSAFPSFDWTAPESDSIFFRHPMLKHQIACALIFSLCAGLVLNNFFKDRLQVTLTKNGIDSLVYLQPKLFVDEVIPQIEHLNRTRPQEGYLPFLPRFYKKQLKETNQLMAMKVCKHILEPNLRQIMLHEYSELKTLYMLGLIHATKDNQLGKYILRHIRDWSQALDLEEQLIKTYVQSSADSTKNIIRIENLDKILATTPLTSAEPWLAFLNRFQEIVNQPVFTGQNFEDIRKEAQYLLGEYRRVKHDAHGFVISNHLKEANTQLMSSFVKNIKILEWLNLNKGVEDFLVFVCQTCPAIPDISDYNVSQFFARLQDFAELKEREKRDNRAIPFALGDEKFSFQTSKWVNLSVTHIIERLIHSYIVANNDTQGDIFFKHTPVLPDLPFQSYRNEFPSFAEPIIINGRYTRLAFEKNVRHTTESLFKLLEGMPINPEDKDRFTRFIQQEVASYAKQYQQEYERVYAACDIRSSSLEDTREILEKILESSSSFQHFLNTVNYHTEVFSDPPACLSILEEMNHFYFLRSLMSKVKNKKSPFEGYQSLISNMLALLKSHAELRTDTSTISLDQYLTPSAKVSLAILRNDPDSYLNQIIENLIEIGVPPNYHHLFTAPVMQVYSLGIKDLRKGVDKLWAESLEPQMNFLFAKRPFNSNGDRIATFEEVSKITNPKGEFWTIIRQIISPLSTYVEGRWYPKPSADLQLTSQFYAEVNRLAKISSLLWDNEGNPQPIALKVQSLPFKAAEKVYPTPILSYLVTGEETFHNFNQNPTWHSIKIDWWKENSSTVVVELTNKNDSKAYRDEKVLNSQWSFFELLKKAEEHEKNVWLWALGDKTSEKTSQVALRFETSPWELFQTETPAASSEIKTVKN